jgi:DNA-binding winged helix-turn-helix (wHTH) protein
VDALRSLEVAVVVEFAFGDFRLMPRSRMLLREGRPVCLGSRAFDLLHALLRSAGTLIPKEALVSEVWPSTFVDESNLRFQMACLRKALGSERHVLKTIPGRGYVFTGECQRVERRTGQPRVPEAALKHQVPEAGCPAQILHLPIRSSDAAAEAESRADPHGAINPAALTGTLFPNSDQTGLHVGTVDLQREHQDIATILGSTLLLPVLVLNGGVGAGPMRESDQGPAVAITLDHLLRLLRPSLCREGANSE